jgi:hypothetical protein
MVFTGELILVSNILIISFLICSFAESDFNFRDKGLMEGFKAELTSAVILAMLFGMPLLIFTYYCQDSHIAITGVTIIASIEQW